jgi:HK97 gp10 family phage protein
MAMFKNNSDFDFDKIIPKALSNENLGKEMVRAGLEVMRLKIEAGASRHRKTGSLAASVKATKPGKTSDGAIYGKVYFRGKDKKGTSNVLKAIILEYGSKKQRPKPFVRGAVQSANSEINTAMKNVFEREASK